MNSSIKNQGSSGWLGAPNRLRGDKAKARRERKAQISSGMATGKAGIESSAAEQQPQSDTTDTSHRSMEHSLGIPWSVGLAGRDSSDRKGTGTPSFCGCGDFPLALLSHRGIQGMFGGSQQLSQAQPCHHGKTFQAAQVHFWFSQTKSRPGVRLETLGCVSCPAGCENTKGPSRAQGHSSVCKTM